MVLPILEFGEGVLVINGIHDDSCVYSLVVHARYILEPFGSSSVPYRTPDDNFESVFQLDLLREGPIIAHICDIFFESLDLSVDEHLDQSGLADIGLTHEDNLELMSFYSLSPHLVLVQRLVLFLL